MKVIEPLVLQKLQTELLAPRAVRYITSAVEREVKRITAEKPSSERVLEQQLDAKRRKLQNLIAAIEGGSDAPAALLKAVKEREFTITRLERDLRKAATRTPFRQLPDTAWFVEEQLQDLTALLHSDTTKVKAEFRRLNLQLTFNPTEAKPRPHYIVNGQCELSALAVSYLRSRPEGASLDRSLARGSV